MTQNQVQDQIRNAVDQFVADVTKLVRQAALDSVSAALGGNAAAPAAPARRGPGRPPGSGAGRRAAKLDKAGRRTASAVGDTATQLHTYVGANPGQNIGEIAAGMGASSKDLRLPVLKLIADGKLRTEGQKRGTRYFTGRGGATAAPKVTKGKKKRGRRGRRKA